MPHEELQGVITMESTHAPATQVDVTERAVPSPPPAISLPGKGIDWPWGLVSLLLVCAMLVVVGLL